MKALLIAAIILVVAASAGLFHIYKQARTLPPGPGSAQFQSASEKLGHTGDAAFGNSPKAIQLADRMRNIMEKMGQEYFTGSSTSRIAAYCELDRDSCAFLIYMPGLYRYDAQSKQKLAETAWVSAQPLFRHLPVEERPAKLAIGLRDGIPYDVVWTGRVTDDPLLDADEKDYGINSRTKLYPFFVPSK
jgi:hypothetical protein